MTENCCSDNNSCGCSCGTTRENKLCELTKPHNKFDVNKIMPLVDQPKFFCRCCGRLANEKESLCNPMELKK